VNNEFVDGVCNVKFSFNCKLDSPVIIFHSMSRQLTIIIMQKETILAWEIYHRQDSWKIYLSHYHIIHLQLKNWKTMDIASINQVTWITCTVFFSWSFQPHFSNHSVIPWLFLRISLCRFCFYSFCTFRFWSLWYTGTWLWNGKMSVMLWSLHHVFKHKNKNCESSMSLSRYKSLWLERIQWYSVSFLLKDSCTY
jgi:hypothetical protein